MMNSQQPDDEGDFPPNPFVSNPDDAVGGFQSGAAEAAPAFAQFAQPPPAAAPLQQPAPMPIPPAPRPATHLDPSEASFAPIDTSQYVGSGAMDTGAPGGAAGDGSRMTSGGARGVGSAESQPLGGAGLGPTAQIQMCFSIDTYKAYFDVDTIDVQNRIVAAMLTCNIPDGFRHSVMGVNSPEGKGPDLYGPFWITTTLVFFLAVTSNLHLYFHTTDDNFEADIFHLIHSTWILFTYAFLLPALLFVTFRCLAIQLPLMELVCLYGYSLIPYYPASLLCLVPAAWFEWIVLLVATAVSGLLVLRNVAGPILSSDSTQQKAGPLIICVMVFHVIFLLTLKLTFFHPHKAKQPSD